MLSPDKKENQAALLAADFVKYVLPFGANNRDSLHTVVGRRQEVQTINNDKCRRNTKATSLEVNEAHLKLHNELQSLVGDRSVENFADLKTQAKAAIKYGAGNCEQQTAVALIYLLALGKVEAVSRRTVELWTTEDRNNLGCLKSNGHVYLEFEEKGSNQVTVFDPWDDNTIQLYEKGKKINHTGVRADREFKPLMRFDGQEEGVSDLCKGFLKECIDQSKVMSDDEKIKALKKLQIPLLEILEDYKTKRSSENRFRIFKGYSSKTKISACEKLMKILVDGENTLTKEEIGALKEGKLGKIISNYQNELPRDVFTPRPTITAPSSRTERKHSISGND